MNSVLISLFLYYFVGMAVIRTFPHLKMLPFIARFSLAYGFGVGIITSIMLFFSLVSFPWNRTIFVFTFSLFSISLILFKLKKLDRDKKQRNEFLFAQKVLHLGTVLTVIYAIIEAVIRPIIAWDAVATWLVGAKVAFFSSGITRDLYQYLNFDNPPIIFLQVAFAYVIGNIFNDQYVGLLFTFYFISLLTFFYYSLKQETSQTYAALFTFLLASTQAMIRQAGKYDVGYADLPLSYFFFCSGVLLVSYIKVRKWDILFASVTFAGFGALVKNEGLPFFLFIVLVGLSGCWIFKKYAHNLAMLYGFVLVSVWYFFKITYHLPTNYLARGSFELERLVYVLPAVSLEFFRIQRWHFLWIFFFFIYLSNLRNSERKKIGVSFVVYVLIFLQLVVYILVYLITPLNPIEHIQGSFDRLLLHLAPLAMFISAISGYAILNNIILLHGKKYKLPRRIDTGDT